jgi:hypothetical protein
VHLGSWLRSNIGPSLLAILQSRRRHIPNLGLGACLQLLRPSREPSFFSVLPHNSQFTMIIHRSSIPRVLSSKPLLLWSAAATPLLRRPEAAISKCLLSTKTDDRKIQGRKAAASDLSTGKKGIENLARAQSVPWHRDSAGKTPSYQGRRVSDGEDITMPGRDGRRAP